eukprot:1268739-Rhodomonas_salina.1
MSADKAAAMRADPQVNAEHERGMARGSVVFRTSRSSVEAYALVAHTHTTHTPHTEHTQTHKAPFAHHVCHYTHIRLRVEACARWMQPWSRVSGGTTQGAADTQLERQYLDSCRGEGISSHAADSRTALEITDPEYPGMSEDRVPRTALQFCPCGLCLAENAPGLRAAVMSVEMLQVHVDVKLAGSDGRGTSRKDTLMLICIAPQTWWLMLHRGGAQRTNVLSATEKLKAV